MSRRKERSVRSHATAIPPPDAYSRLELAFAAALLLAGIALRCAFPSRIAVEHFDEGVYASNIWFESGEYPYRHLYAPWLLPFLAELSILCFGPTGFGPSAASLAAGCGTVLSVWWISRSWIGRQAAIFSLALASFSDIHAMFSRMALTDVLLVFWLLWAVYFLERALRVARPSEAAKSMAAREGRPTACIACGAFTGLAWWTKYNGWLPLAIGLAAIGLLAVTPATRRETTGRLLSWLVVGAIAAALFVPVWVSLLPTGGYGPVSANHAKYVVGLAGWPASAEQQLFNLAHFDGWASVLAPIVGLGLAVCLSEDENRAARSAQAGVAVIASLYLIAAGAVCGSIAVSSLLAIGGCGWYLARRKSVDEPGSLLVPAVIVLVWLFGLLAATPCYTPYARLTLPLLGASWIGSGFAIRLLTTGGWWRSGHRAQHGHDAPAASAQWRMTFEIPFVAGAILSLVPMFWLGPRISERSVPAWQDHTGLQSVARAAVEEFGPLQDGEQPVLLVYGEPALFFHLRARGAQVMTIGHLGFAAGDRTQLPQATYLLVGPHARRDALFIADWKQVSGRFQPAGEFSYQPSEAVLLDTHHPRTLPSAAERVEKIELFRLLPP